jgi:hypothetical protein
MLPTLPALALSKDKLESIARILHQEDNKSRACCPLNDEKASPSVFWKILQLLLHPSPRPSALGFFQKRAFKAFQRSKDHKANGILVVDARVVSCVTMVLLASALKHHELEHTGFAEELVHLAKTLDPTIENSASTVAVAKSTKLYAVVQTEVNRFFRDNGCFLAVDDTETNFACLKTTLQAQFASL